MWHRSLEMENHVHSAKFKSTNSSYMAISMRYAYMCVDFGGRIVILFLAFCISMSRSTHHCWTPGA